VEESLEHLNEELSKSTLASLEQFVVCSGKIDETENIQGISLID